MDKLTDTALMAAAALTGVAILVALLTLAARRATRADNRTTRLDKTPASLLGRLDNLTTLIAGTLTAGLASEGILEIIKTTVHADTWVKISTFTVFELVSINMVIRAKRRWRLTGRTRPDGTPGTPSTGVYGVLVWVIAGTSGLISASAEHTPGSIGLRLAPPVMSVLVFHSGLYMDRLVTATPVAWKWTKNRVMIMLGLADAEARTTSQAVADAALDRATAAAYRRHTWLWGFRWMWGVQLRRTVLRYRLDDTDVAVIVERLRVVRTIEALTSPLSTPTVLPADIPTRTVVHQVPVDKPISDSVPVDSVPVDSRTADITPPPAGPVDSGQDELAARRRTRTALPAADLAAWVADNHPELTSRADVAAAIRAEYGSLSSQAAADVMKILKTLRTATG